MTSIGKFFLFFSSWVPAYVIMALIAQDNRPIMIACMALAIASVFLYFAMEKLIFGRAPRSLKIKAISRRDENILMYVIAYLPPFFALDVSKSGQLWALAVFYVVFAITYVKLNLYYLNPMFIFRSYRTYTLISESGEEYVALIKFPFVPVAGETIQYRGRDHILLISGD